MTTEIWFTGKHWDGFIKDGVAFYEKRLKQVFPVITDFLKEGGASADSLDREAAQVFKKIQPGDFVILLDESGDHFTSRGFATWFDQIRLRAPRRVIFILGGAYGFSNSVRDRADGFLSLSKMTFNHQLARLVFMEQLYRGITILQGHPYHHD